MATPEEAWRDVLLAKLAVQRVRAGLFMRYYAGDHRLPRAPARATEAYQRLMNQSRTNWCRLVVDAVAERLRVVGFRFGESPAGDAEAWAIWQANGMDADSEMAHNDALVCGNSFVLVWPEEDTPAGASITIEHPVECTVAYEPGNRRRRIAGLKSWLDPLAARQTAWLVTADGTWTWERAVPLGYSPDPLRPTVELAGNETWELVETGENRLGEVPLVELRPWPQTLGWGWAEIDGGVIDIQDRINTTIFNRLMATEFAAFRQKYVTGLVLPTVKDPATGEPVLDATGNEIAVAPFDVAVDRLWVAEDAGVKFGEFSESDLTGYIRAVEADVQHLAAITKTPPHYLLGSIVNASGDALKAAEAGLVHKVSLRAAHLGESWEEVMRLCFSARGDVRAVDVQAEVMWADFETRSEAEHVDALVKLATIGVPRQVLWEKAGASPQEVERWTQFNATEALIGSLAAPAPAPANVPPR